MYCFPSSHEVMPCLPSQDLREVKTRRHIAQYVKRDDTVEIIYTELIYKLVDASLALFAVAVAAPLSPSFCEGILTRLPRLISLMSSLSISAAALAPNLAAAMAEVA